MNSALTSWLSICNPTTGVPLTYVLHESADVPAEDFDKFYLSIDDDLIATMKNSGHQFSIDNQHVFGLHKQLIVDHPAWAYKSAF